MKKNIRVETRIMMIFLIKKLKGLIPLILVVKSGLSHLDQILKLDTTTSENQIAKAHFIMLTSVSNTSEGVNLTTRENYLT